MDFDHVVMDTDVASLTFKPRRAFPPSITEALLGKPAVITFVTLGELTKWAVKRDWGTSAREHLERWLQNVVVLPPTDEVARTWGELAAYAEKRGRPKPQNDTWIAACCLTYGAALATFNRKDFSDFAEYEGLVLL